MPYIDKNIINNSSLACFILIFFIEEYEKKAIDNRHPDLMQLLLILPFAWHKISRDAIKTKKSSTQLDAVIQEAPLIKSNFNQRVSDYMGSTLQGLNLAFSSGMLLKIEGNNEIFFKRSSKRWPVGVKKALPDDICKATIRLANWFYHLDTATIYSILLDK
ncbi:TPA: three component ABC system middle component [Pluralibacter gergoviae]